MNNKQVHLPIDCLLGGVQHLKPQTHTVWLDGWEGPHISSTHFLAGGNGWLTIMLQIYLAALGWKVHGFFSSPCISLIEPLQIVNPSYRS